MGDAVRAEDRDAERPDAPRAVELTAAVAPHADRIEVGTSLIKHFGIGAVREVAAAATVLGSAADATLDVVALSLAGRLAVDNDRARAAHANTE